jgi:hypothetical protein
MNVRVRGRAKVGMLAAFAVAVANLRSADRWHVERARVRALNLAILTAAKSRSPRRTHTLNKLLPAKHRKAAASAAAARAPNDLVPAG